MGELIRGCGGRDRHRYRDRQTWGDREGVEYTHPCSLNRKNVLFSEAVNIFFYIVFSLGLHRGVNISYSVSSVFKHKTKLSISEGLLAYIYYAWRKGEKTLLHQGLNLAQILMTFRNSRE